MAIQRFAVIPLSTNSGLIGWVPHSDTLHGLIKDYRDKKKIVLNLEHRLMQRMATDYDHLPLMKKVEVCILEKKTMICLICSKKWHNTVFVGVRT